MIDLPHIADLCRITPSKIVMLVMDGLGGLPHPETGRSELETAHLPNLDRLARESACGLITPVLPGITPGSAPGHLALFGYDPLKYFIGRGVLEALGVGLELQKGDIAARGNFCTVDREGRITDRRAGRISTEENASICQELNRITLPEVSLFTAPSREHRFVLVLRGEGLSPHLSETDPQSTGVPPLEVKALSPQAERTAQILNRFIAEARQRLSSREKANMVLLRGFSQLPSLPHMGDRYKLNPAAIAAYPMYRGLAKVVGMRVLAMGSDFSEEVKILRSHYSEHDFFFIHYKAADTAGEDGDFARKVRALEELDSHLPGILDLEPDVLIVTGDHSTPSIMATHSWHPVPVMLRSRWTVGEGVEAFSERSCASGSLGVFPAQHLMLLALAHAQKLLRFGA